MRQVIPAVLMLAGVAMTAEGQVPAINQRVAKALPSSWTPPKCEVKEGHFLVSSGATYLKSAGETSNPANRERMYSDAERVLTQAITEKGQDDNGGAWYYLARAYLRNGDIVGADSAFTKAATMVPDCVTEINELRRSAWVALVRPGAQFLQEGNTDSAFVLIRAANSIYREEPNGFYYLGIMYANTGQNDSAITNFSTAAEIAGKSEKLAADRNQATYNLGVVLSNAGRFGEAATTFENYLQWSPDDADAKKALARAYRQSGQDEKAKALEDELVSASSGDDATMTGADLYTIGVNAFNDKDFARAADAFNRVLEREPHNRDALFNLTNAYLGMGDGAKLVAAAERLVAIDPLNENAQKLLGEGYRQAENQDKLLEVFTAIEAAPATLEIKGFDPRASKATLRGVATGRQAHNVSGTNLKATPINLTFEFMNDEGEVVATQPATIPVLQPGETKDLTVEAQGERITWWRYKRTK